MAHFVSDTNNGVTALVTLNDCERINNGQKPEYGIFLFCDALDWPVHAQPWFHGDMAMMGTLLEGHQVSGGYFRGVPFSNGAMLYSDRQTLLDEIVQIAPMHKVLEAFQFELRSLIAVS